MRGCEPKDFDYDQGPGERGQRAKRALLRRELEPLLTALSCRTQPQHRAGETRPLHLAEWLQVAWGKAVGTCFLCQESIFPSEIPANV